MVPTNNESIFVLLMTFRGKQILAKKIGGNHAFFRDNKATIILNNSKIQSNVLRFFFQIEALLFLKNARLPQIFFLDTKSTC